MEKWEILIRIGEIVVLWIVIYQAYRFRRERAVMMLGGLIILILFIISFVKIIRARELEFLGTILVPVGTFLAVLFQNELRTALTRIGGSVFRGLVDRNKAGESERFDAICDAVAYLANRRYGALIVLQRANRLSEHITGGERIDAELSAGLLESIFYKGSALHDGAVIINNDRIVTAAGWLPPTEREIYRIVTAAGYLPLTERERLGARHRAAIGMAEKSDAVVIVVSEENGTISLAVGSERGNPSIPLERGFTPDTLKQRLIELFRNHEREETHTELHSRSVPDDEEGTDG